MSLKKIERQLFIVSLLMVIFTGCGQKQENGFSQTQNDIHAIFSISPTTPVSMEPTTLILKIQDSQGRPIRSAKIQFNLVMPSMMMPLNQPKVIENTNGLYRGDAIFSMPGDWRVETSVKSGDGETIFFFDFPVK